MNIDNPPPPIPSAEQSPASRHGCLTAWLILMLIANAATAITTPLSVANMAKAGLQVNSTAVGVIVICAVANLIFAIALFRWMKWGFWGFCVTSAAALVTNLSIGLGIGQSLFGLIGIGLLYWVLNMGETNKAWPRLR
jgi:hypothetical protein